MEYPYTARSSSLDELIRMPKENQLNLEKGIVKTMRLLYRKSLITPTGGNVSARLSGSASFWITPSSRFKGDLNTRDLVKVTLGGKWSSRGVKPSVETLLHSEIYRTRSDVNAIIHAHCPVTLGVALAGAQIRPLTPEGVLFVGEAPVAEFETPGTKDLASAVAEVLKSHQFVVMQNHGVVTVGRSLLEALNRLEIVEMTARIMTVAHIWGVTPSLTAAQLEKLRSLTAA
jgi:L-fuculose-phosphate aldolase